MAANEKELSAVWELEKPQFSPIPLLIKDILFTTFSKAHIAEN